MSVLLVLLAALLLAGSAAQRTDGRRWGSALAADGMQSSGSVGNDNARVGEIWYFALPVPSNISADPIGITQVAVEHVPPGIEVLGYGAYHLYDTDGLPMLAKKGEPHTPDFARLRNYADQAVEVPAGEGSDIFYLAELKITAPPEGPVRRCRFEYTQNGRAHTQTMDCELILGATP
ncbi:hypothetical protein [Streptomyces sp. NPDC059452]|uniref:hypothetical protein n=1 Tax=Streptomyces sp. NPDC059452 TaxID=3346835 RepID=UPI0036D09D61